MKKIALLIILTAVAGFACSCSSLSMNPVHSCGAKELPAHAKNRNAGAGLIAQKWENENTLTVHTYLYALCDGSSVSGRYSVDGNKITISYSESIGSNPTKCRCASQYKHRISGLKKQEYAIVVQNDD